MASLQEERGSVDSGRVARGGEEFDTRGTTPLCATGVPAHHLRRAEESEIDSSALANYYAQDFEQIWEKENFDNTGEIQTVPVPLTFSGQSAEARVMFSPGCGLEIDSEIAKRVRAAQRRVRICSLLINSGTLIGELGNLLRAGRVAVDGIYDRTQMAQVYVQWQEVPQNRWKIGALKDIIARAGLVGKNSTPYTPTGRHDYMHNKILLIDDTVITGSYNFSRSAQFNAENILFIDLG